jgi:hypothetical protein
LRWLAGPTALATLLVACSDSPSIASASADHPRASGAACVAAWATVHVPKPSSSTAGMSRLGVANVPDGLAAMAAVSARDIWAVGAFTRDPTKAQVTTLIEHWDGTRWTIVGAPHDAASTPSGQPGALLSGVAATSSHDVWAVGAVARAERSNNGNERDLDQTLAEHWNGSRWSVVPVIDETPDDALVAVSARSSSDVWAVGTSNHTVDPSLSFVTPLVEHWDGTRWSLVHVPTPGLDPANAGAVAAVVAGYNAGAFKEYDDASFSAVHAIAADDVWAVGMITRHDGPGDAPTQTFTEHWDGTAWRVVNAPDVQVGQLQHGADDSLNAVTATRRDDVWAVGAASPQGTLTLHWDGTSWTVIPSAHAGTFSYLSDVAAISATNVWAVGNAIEHWDGRRWTQTATIGGKTFAPLAAITAVSANDIWMVGADDFLHYTCR